MCFFKKIKTEDVFKMARTKMLAWNTKGIPTLSYRTSTNYYESKYNYVEKNKCGFALKTEKDGLRLEFNFSYDKKDKEAWFRIFVYDLDLSYSKEGMRLIKEKYKQFDFSFMGLTLIVCKKRVCKTVQDCFKYLTDSMAAWNTCDLYSLLVDLKKLSK